MPALTNERAPQRFLRLIQQISRTTDPLALAALAQALPALLAKLTETQASQALDLVLNQIDHTTDPFVLLALEQALPGVGGRRHWR